MNAHAFFLGIGQSLDSVTFALFFLLIPAQVMEAAGKTERNPILAVILAFGGVVAVVAFKQLLSAFAIWRLSRNRKTRKVKYLSVFAGISGLVGALFNTIAILQIMG